MSQSPDFFLLLPDEILALALDPEKGTFGHRDRLAYLFAGAMLIELSVNGRLDRDGRASFLVINSVPDDPDPLINWALEKLFSQAKNRFIKYWIMEPEAFGDLPQKLYERHLEAGLLSHEVKRSLTFTNYDYWTWLTPEYRDGLFDLIKAAADGSTETDIRTYSLLKLIRACPRLFSHLVEPEDWDGVPEPTLKADDQHHNLALIENIYSILRSAVNEK